MLKHHLVFLASERFERARARDPLFFVKKESRLLRHLSALERARTKTATCFPFHLFSSVVAPIRLYRDIDDSRRDSLRSRHFPPSTLIIPREHTNRIPVTRVRIQII